MEESWQCGRWWGSEMLLFGREFIFHTVNSPPYRYGKTKLSFCLYLICLVLCLSFLWFNGFHWFCVKNLCTTYCCKSLNRQSSGVQEWINPFYINSYGENSFGLRTTFRNELSSWTEVWLYLGGESILRGRERKESWLMGIVFWPQRHYSSAVGTSEREMTFECLMKGWFFFQTVHSHILHNRWLALADIGGTPAEHPLDSFRPCPLWFIGVFNA